MRRPLACGIALLLGACSTLPPIEHAVCGNGIIEDGEDCDSPLASCQACSLTCGSDDDCVASAGAGFVCGADDLCHAPAGTFVEGSLVTLDVDTLRIADVDGDRFGDVVAQSPTTVSVLYGDPDGSLHARAAVQAPIAKGPVTWARLDDDDRPDLLVPTADGVAAFTFAFGVPSPYTWPRVIDAGALGEPLATFPLSGNYVGGVVAAPAGLALIVLDVHIGRSDDVVGAISMCGAAATGFDPSHVSLATAGAQLPRTHVMYAAMVGTGADARPCVIALDENPFGAAQPFRLSEVDVSGAPNPDGATLPLLVDLVGAGGPRCPALMIQKASGGLAAVPAASPGAAGSPCGLATDATPLSRIGSVSLFPSPLGVVPLAGALGIVLTDGVYRYDAATSTLQSIYQSDRTLTAVKPVALNPGAADDLVAISADAEDFDLLYQVTETSPLTMKVTSSFLRVRVDTEAPVTLMETGDFDGNTMTDFAYVEHFDDGDRLSVAYGTSDRPLPGQPVGTFATIFSMLPVGIPDSNDPFELVDDLAVLYRDGDARQLTLLHGSPQRTMQAYYESVGAPGSTGNVKFDLVATLPGRFNGGLGGRDLLEFDTTPSGGAVIVTPAAPGGQLSTSPRCGTTTLAACGPTSVGTGVSSMLCTNDAVYAVAPHGDLDLVLAVDGRGNGVTLDPTINTVCGPDAFAEVVYQSWGNALGLEPNAPLRRARTLDLISTDPPELAVTLQPFLREDAVAPVVRTCLLDDQDLPQACEDPAVLVSAAVGSEVSCGDLAAGRAFPVTRNGAAPPARKDLFVMCASASVPRTLYRISRLADGPTVTALFPVPGASEIKVGDVNGDAIDDVITVQRGTGSTTLQVYLQCTSRNTACGAQ